MSRSIPTHSRLRLLGILLAAGLLAVATTQCGGTVTPNTNLFVAAQNNTAPVARATSVDEAAIGAPMTLDGTASYDPDGDEIIFNWSVDSRPEASTMGSNPFTANEDRNAGVTTLTPDVEGVYIIALVVEDDAGLQSHTDYVVFEASVGLDLPIADAGPNITALEGTEICLDGSNSHDPGGLELDFTWTLVSVPDASAFTSADLVVASDSACMVPDAPGSYAVALVVNNGLIDSEPDFAFVAAGSSNQGPTAVAEFVGGASCDFIVLSAENSSDPEDDTLFYNWDLLAVPPGSSAPLGQDAFDDPSAMLSSFYADMEGEYTLQLVVNDGEDYSTPVFLEVSVSRTTENQPPVVITSPDAYFSAPSPNCSTDAYGNCVNCPNCGSIIVPMDALSTTDPDGDPVTIQWEVLSGPANTQLEFEDGWLNELTLPGPPGSCSSSISTNQAQVQITAVDCVGDSATGLVTVVYDCGG